MDRLRESASVPDLSTKDIHHSSFLWDNTTKIATKTTSRIVEAASNFRSLFLPRQHAEEVPTILDDRILVESMSYRQAFDTAWSKIKYNGWLLWHSDKFMKESSIWLLGKFYKINNPGDESSEIFQKFLEDFRSRIWLTYRTGLARFPASNSTTDSGWGCTIRSCQMMVAQTLILLNLGREWRFFENLNSTRKCKDDSHLNIVSLFSDDLDSDLGIHRLIHLAISEKSNAVGCWYSPSVALSLLQKALLNSTSNVTNFLIMHNVIDGLLVKKDVVCASNNFARPVLVTVSVRLGTDSINSCYFNHIINFFSLKNGVGIVGGRPRHSMYFVGAYGKKSVIYLDPHTAHYALSPSKLSNSYGTFHCDHPEKLPLEDIDPSCSLGFLVRSEAEYDTTIKELNEIHFIETEVQKENGFHPIFTALKDYPPMLKTFEISERYQNVHVDQDFEVV